MTDHPISQELQSLEENVSPAVAWEEEESKHALDELFNATLDFRKSLEYDNLLKFVKRFRFYSPYNGLLIRIQRPGAVFVAPANRWRKLYQRRIKPGANPIAILQPMGPVMFVFDVADTEPEKGAPPFPEEILNPFELYDGRIGCEYETTIENAKRDGIRISESPAGSYSAGLIKWVEDGKSLQPLRFHTGLDDNHRPVYKEIEVRFDIILNSIHTREAKYITLAHELAHLYCGHLGTPNKKWWPDRRGLPLETQEFEAESVASLVCSRAGIDSGSERYLADYVRENEFVPKISLECVMKSAGLIESMGKKLLKIRKEK